MLTASATTKQKSKTTGLHVFMVTVGCWWLTDIITSLLVRSGYFFRLGVPFAIKTLVMASHYEAWFFAGLAPLIIFYLFKPYVKTNRILNATGKIALILIGWFCTLTFVISWVVYKRSSSFIDFEGINLAIWNPLQLLLHVLQVEQAGLFMAVAGSCVLFVAMFALIRFLVSKLPNRIKRSILGLSMVILVLGIVAPLLAESADARSPQLIYDPTERVYLSRAELLEYMRHYHTSPVARVLYDLVRKFEDTKGTTGPDFSLFPESRRIISMDEYLHDVSRDQFKGFNVLHVLVESLRSDRLKALGGSRPVVPSIDRLAESSYVFGQAYAASTHSDYADLCTLNSHYPLRSRSHHYYQTIRYPRLLIYDILKALGYRTAIFSSQNESWGGMLNYLDDGNLDRIFHSENFEGDTYVETLDWGFAKKLQMGMLQAGKIEDKFTVRAAMDWIRENQDKPFFLSLNLQSSHFPYRTPEGVKPAYEPYEIDFPVSFVGYGNEHLPVMINRYDNALRYIDSLLNELFEYLRSSGLMEKTIIVVTGDNGEAFKEHNSVTHAGRLWNEVLKVPIVIHVPQENSRIFNHPVGHIDIPPTVLRLLGLPPHPSFQGKNMLDAGLLNKPGDRPLYFIAQANLATQDALIYQDFKLIYDRRINRYGLFDLKQDPGETVNLIRFKPAVFKKLRQMLTHWYEQQIWYYEHPELYTKYYPPDFS